MKTISGRLFAVMMACAVVSAPALAEGPHKGGGKGGIEKHQRGGGGGEHGGGKQRGGNDHDRGGQGNGHGSGHGSLAVHDRDIVTIKNYFAPQFAAGNCPPGLAKKHNGCLPPGQAKKWAVGQQLPHGVGYDLPAGLLAQLTIPPAGYKYVRVASDILLIAAGTGLIAAAVADLSQL